MKQLIIGLIVIFLFSTADISWPGPFGAEQAYYKGIYDACMFAGVAMELTPIQADTQCRVLVRMAKRMDWYHHPPIKQEGNRPTRSTSGALWIS